MGLERAATDAAIHHESSSRLVYRHLGKSMQHVSGKHEELRAGNALSRSAS